MIASIQPRFPDSRIVNSMDPVVARVLLTCSIAWLISQILKFVINFHKNGNSNFSQLLFSQGGMPSSHSAFVTALALALLLEEGLNSTTLVAFAYGIITIRDAIGVRFEVGLHAVSINNLNGVCQPPNERSAQKFEEHVGHTLVEAVAGVIVGTMAVLCTVVLTL